MEPFDQYPGGGCELIGRPRSSDGTCRRGYGLDFQRRTGTTRCAYCGVDLVDDYYRWLLMAVDHVVPASELARLKIPPEFGGDCINLVLACSGCNGFRNKHTVSRSPQSVWTLGDFVALRDEVLQARRQIVERRRALEFAFFEARPWTSQQGRRLANPPGTPVQDGQLVANCPRPQSRLGAQKQTCSTP